MQVQRVVMPIPDFCTRVQRARCDLTQGPEVEWDLLEPSFGIMRWRRLYQPDEAQMRHYGCVNVLSREGTSRPPSAAHVAGPLLQAVSPLLPLASWPTERERRAELGHVWRPL